MKLPKHNHPTTHPHSPQTCDRCKLEAAAPDLLEACIRLRARCHCEEGECGMCKLLDSAIAKATE